MCLLYPSFSILLRRAGLCTAHTVPRGLFLRGGWRGIGLYHGGIGFHSTERLKPCSSSLQPRAARARGMRTSSSRRALLCLFAVCRALLCPGGAGHISQGFTHILGGEISLRRWYHQEQFGLFGDGGRLPAG